MSTCQRPSCRCAGKRAYRSWSAAGEVLERMRYQGAKDARYLVVYQCERCDRFHLGHPPGFWRLVAGGGVAEGGCHG